MTKSLDIETFEWLMAKPRLPEGKSFLVVDPLKDEDILYLLVSCALELDRAGCLSSSLKRAKPYHEAAALIVQAIKVL